MRCKVGQLRSLIKESLQNWRILGDKVIAPLKDNLHLRRVGLDVLFMYDNQQMMRWQQEVHDGYIDEESIKLWISKQHLFGELSSLDDPRRFDISYVAFHDEDYMSYLVPFEAIWAVITPNDLSDFRPDEPLPEDYYAL